MAGNSMVSPMLSSGWLTADTSGPDASGRVAVTQDNDTALPNPQVPTQDSAVDTDLYGLNAGPNAEEWDTTTSFPWPSVAESHDGVVAVTPGMTGNGNTNDDPMGLPGYDGPFPNYSGAYVQTVDQGGLDAVAQRTDSWGFNEMQPGANMGYERMDTRLIGNTSPGYVNVWSPIWNVTPPVKTANQFTQQPLTDMGNSLPPYASLDLANSGGTAYYLDGPVAPQTVAAGAVQGTEAADPAAGWA